VLLCGVDREKNSTEENRTTTVDGAGENGSSKVAGKIFLPEK